MWTKSFTLLLNCVAKVVYISFDKFLLAIESRDLSQADKSIMKVSSFPKLFLNDNIIDPRRDVCIQFFIKQK